MTGARLTAPPRYRGRGSGVYDWATSEDRLSKADYELRAEWWFTLAAAITVAVLGLLGVAIWLMQPIGWVAYMAMVGIAVIGIVLPQAVRWTTTQAAMARRVSKGLDP